MIPNIAVISVITTESSSVNKVTAIININANTVRFLINNHLLILQISNIINKETMYPANVATEAPTMPYILIRR